MIDHTSRHIEQHQTALRRENRRRYAFQRMLAATDRLLGRVEELNRDGVKTVPKRVRTQIRDAFSMFHNPFVSIDVLLSWGTNRFAVVRVRHDPRRLGVSNYTFRKLMVHALNMMTGFSSWPLRLASLIGFSFTLFGLAVLVFVLGRFLAQGTSVPGFPFIASLIAIFSGAQLVTLGIIGEYLARVYTRTMERPGYVVRRP